MNGQHVRAFFWLHWRLRVNQFKRGGTANAVIMALLTAAAVLLAGLLFVGCLLIGAQLAPAVRSAWLMYVWDGLTAAFLFCWGIGLVIELQRAEALSLEKFLHLPVSLSGVFVLNYLSSLLSLSLIVFVPAMLGLALGLVVSRGPAQLLVVPLLAAMLLMVTAVTYQFQGWLASLMVNKRRRRTIVVLITAVFVLLFQLPNLWNLYRPWEDSSRANKSMEINNQWTEEIARAQKDWAAGKLTLDQYQQQLQAIEQASHTRLEESSRQQEKELEQVVRLVNLVLPPGWLPLGARGVAEGNVLPALLGTLGLTLIGTASLWRAYRTTLRLYTGQFSSGKRQTPRPEPGVQPAAAQAALPASRAASFLERDLPGVSEPAAAIALVTLRSLMRAPEVKMILLSPILMVVIFGGLFLRGPMNIPETARPFLPLAGLAMILFSLVQLVGNQFGFDRSGFRVFVLCPARRRDILLGKNLAVAVLALVLATPIVILVEAVFPLRFDHLLAILPQAVTMYLLFCLAANWMSVLAPVPMASGSLKPASAKGMAILLHILFIFVFPLALAPSLLPLGLEVLLAALGWAQGLPVCLMLSVLECVAMVYLYRLVLTWQGSLLQAREQRILKAVAAKAE